MRWLPSLLLALVCGFTLHAEPSAAEASPAPVEIVRAGAPEILAAVRDSGATVVVVNMWATWCIPCREEFPDLLRLRDRYAGRGVKLILVSGDFEATVPHVEEFLAERGVTQTYLKTGEDTQFIDTFDPEWSGALPATFFYDAAGERRASIFGQVTYEALEEKVSRLLASQPGR